jgi:hypothetical protein
MIAAGTNTAHSTSDTPTIAIPTSSRLVVLFRYPIAEGVRGRKGEEGSPVGQQRTTLSDDAIAKLRKQFGPELAKRFEEWTLKVPYPEPTLKMLTRTFLADHIRQVASVLNGAGRDISEDDIARLVVFANDAIASEIDRRFGSRGT